MNTSMNLQRISVDRLKPAKYNPRKDLKPGDPAYEKIRRSLHEFGYVDPVIWNEVMVDFDTISREGLQFQWFSPAV